MLEELEAVGQARMLLKAVVSNMRASVMQPFIFEIPYLASSKFSSSWINYISFLEEERVILVLEFSSNILDFELQLFVFNPRNVIGSAKVSIFPHVFPILLHDLFEPFLYFGSFLLGSSSLLSFGM